MDNLRKRLNAIEKENGNISLQEYFIFLKYAINTEINYKNLLNLSKNEIKEVTMK